MLKGFRVQEHKDEVKGAFQVAPTPTTVHNQAQLSQSN
jgi:hypothetical protein